jgi:hypothetical protein
MSIAVRQHTTGGSAGCLTDIYKNRLGKPTARRVSSGMREFPNSALTGLDYYGECRRGAWACAASGAGRDFFHLVELDSRRVAVSVGEVPPDANCARLFYARVDGRIGELRYVNAGDECALLVRNSPENVCRLENSAYRERTLPLDPGDLLVVVSDGITDALGRSGTRWGPAGVIEVVMQNLQATAASLTRKLIGAVDSFTGEVLPAHDRTAVVVRFQGRGELTTFEAEVEDHVLAAA